MIGATGIWSHEEQSAHIFSYGVARWIAKNTAGLIYDFGAGNGDYTTYLKEIGRECVSIDGYNSGKIDIIQDLTKEFNLGELRNVICIEVFEHIPKEFEEVFVDNISRHCNGKLIISVAHEGQPGLGHVNCRPGWYVKKLFQAKRFKHLEKESNALRNSAEGYVGYLRENLFVFTR